MKSETNKNSVGLGFLTALEEEALKTLVNGEPDREQVVSLTSKFLSYAVARGVSDIHIEPTRTNSLVRYRLDGVLYDVIQLPLTLHESLVARVKVLAELKTDEHRIPQDGRFSGTMEERIIDFRVSSMPTIFGEKVAIRLLPQEIKQTSIEDLGFSPHASDSIKNMLRKPYGMILVCGPTGVGKTTTLYTLLKQLMSERGHTANLYTIEDPVEYSIERINQIQVNPSVGLTYHAVLRGLLRQDTDIIMVGEVRDKETAEAATQAALTGRQLLSSLHTRNAVGALIRLLEIGIEPYLVASAVTIIIAQRLVRLNCPDCTKPYFLDENAFAELDRNHNLSLVLNYMSGSFSAGKGPLKLFRGKGCDKCHFTGYRGRIGIYEVLEMSEVVREMVQKRSTASVLLNQAVKEGMLTMMQDGFAKVLEGKTTLEEVLKVTLD